MTVLIPSSLAGGVVRAVAALDESIERGRVIYRMGQGGFVPTAEWPWDKERELDCSGFAAWCWGMPRHYPEMPYGDWIETSQIVSDAESGAVVFVQLAAPQIGCGVVWPDRRVAGVKREGHIGIVAQVEDDALGASRATSVIHCSSGNFRATGNAIRLTSPAIFDKHGAIYVAPRRLMPE